MEHIFWAENSKSGFCFSKEEINHLSVLRITLPAELLFTPGDGNLYSGTVEIDGKISKVSKIKSSQETFINIYFGVCDKNRIKYILEKCTELGADSFTPIITERSEKFSLNEERANKIVVSALKQSRRFKMPEYRKKIKLTDIPADKETEIIFGSIREDKREIKLNKKRVSLVIGPPLGFTEEEEKTLLSKGAKPFHFDTGILRTETFAVSLLSIVHYLKGVGNG